MRFEITAYRHGEGVTALQVEAASAEEAGNNIGDQGFEVVSIRQTGRWNKFQRKDRSFDLLLFSQELRSLLDAGLSLIESLGALSRKETADEKRRLIEALIRRLREGKSFSAVLREFPAEFPPLYLALTAASEQTGDLGSAMARFIEYRGRMDAIKKRVISAAIYPALLLGVGGCVILFLMTYVVPRFSRVYEDFGSNLPFMSKLLLQWGALIESHGLQILVALMVLGIAVVAFFKRKRTGWRSLLRRLLNSKALAPVRVRTQTYTLARFYRTLGLLLHGGIPAVTALGMARELLDEEMQVALDRALIEIRGGVALSEAMERGRLAPPVASDLLRIGEKTGDMGEKMTRIADFYDEETARWADWFARLFEPLLMLTIGLFIAFIVVLLYMPIFELAGSVQ
ncbi:putative Type II secretion system protein F [Georgfuchsia toluolica]|uniref:Type II secretion system protein F n=1 Tax=Georgfuchsia toluolica TaxID=424218 RepID=A0A916J2T3_9PROT|nr:type II secretion system F family protein [Georgfuchsia toluolica]CAG4882944.1 putative Type II secretion system protein F [Georgfuchsia toluolica]